jgi:hypothetical protein
MPVYNGAVRLRASDDGGDRDGKGGSVREGFGLVPGKGW